MNERSGSSFYLGVHDYWCEREIRIFFLSPFYRSAFIQKIGDLQGTYTKIYPLFFLLYQKKNKNIEVQTILRSVSQKNRGAAIIPRSFFISSRPLLPPSMVYKKYQPSYHLLAKRHHWFRSTSLSSGP